VVPALNVLSKLLPKLSRKVLLAFREEAVRYIACINVVCDDHPRRSGVRGDSALAYACARARGVKRGDGTVTGAHEAVIEVVLEIGVRMK
jgi:hypothetical protein